MHRDVSYSTFGDTDPGPAEAHDQGAVSSFVPERDDLERAPRGELYVVSDGAGGRQAGDVAARYAADAVIYAYYETEWQGSIANLRLALERANADIYQEAQARGDLRGMACSLVAAVVREGKLVIASVGDTRAWLFRRGALGQITRDPSPATEQIAAADPDGVPVEAPPDHPPITRLVGGAAEAHADMFEDDLLPGDAVLLSSGGLHRAVPPSEIEQTLADPELDPKAIVDRLIRLAKQHGSPDNIAAVIIQVAPAEPLRDRAYQAPEAPPVPLRDATTQSPWSATEPPADPLEVYGQQLVAWLASNKTVAALAMAVIALGTILVIVLQGNVLTPEEQPLVTVAAIPITPAAVFTPGQVEPAPTEAGMALLPTAAPSLSSPNPSTATASPTFTPGPTAIPTHDGPLPLPALLEGAVGGFQSEIAGLSALFWLQTDQPIAAYGAGRWAFQPQGIHQLFISRDPETVEPVPLTGVRLIGVSGQPAVSAEPIGITLPSLPEQRLSWSWPEPHSGGTQAVWLAFVCRQTGQQTFDICIYDDVQNLVFLLDNPTSDEIEPAWGPGNESLALAQWAGGRWDLVEYPGVKAALLAARESEDPVNRPEQRAIFEGRLPGRFKGDLHWPSYSADGAILAFHATGCPAPAGHTLSCADTDIYLTRSAHAGIIYKATDSATVDEQPAVSPDGRFIAFASCRAGGNCEAPMQWGTYVLRLDGCESVSPYSSCEGLISTAQDEEGVSETRPAWAPGQ